MMLRRIYTLLFVADSAPSGRSTITPLALSRQRVQKVRRLRSRSLLRCPVWVSLLYHLFELTLSTSSLVRRRTRPSSIMKSLPQCSMKSLWDIIVLSLLMVRPEQARRTYTIRFDAPSDLYFLVTQCRVTWIPLQWATHQHMLGWFLVFSFIFFTNLNTPNPTSASKYPISNFTTRNYEISWQTIFLHPWEQHSPWEWWARTLAKPRIMDSKFSMIRVNGVSWFKV